MSRAKKKYRQRRRSEKPPKELTTREQLIIKRISSVYSRYGKTDRDGKLLSE